MPATCGTAMASRPATINRTLQTSDQVVAVWTRDVSAFGMNPPSPAEPGTGIIDRVPPCRPEFQPGYFLRLSATKPR